MSNDAIDDVSDEANESAGADEKKDLAPIDANRPANPRDEAIRALYDKSNEEYGMEADDAGDGVEAGEEAGEEEEELESAAVDDEGGEEVDLEAAKSSDAEDAAQEPLEALGYYRNDKGDLVTKLNVSGRVVEVTPDQMKAYVQKDLAGDQKLQQAADRERKLEQDQQDLERSREALRREVQPPEMGADELQAAIKSAAGKLIEDGDEDAFAEGMASLMQQRQAPTVDEETLRQMVKSESDNRDAAKARDDFGTSLDKGIERFESEYKELANDTALSAVVNDKTREFMAIQRDKDHPNYSKFINKTPEELLIKAAEDTQEWWSGRDGKPEKVVADGGEDRQANKDKLKRMPKGQGHAHAKEKPKAPVTDALTIINAKRQNRSLLANV